MKPAVLLIVAPSFRPAARSSGQSLDAGPVSGAAPSLYPALSDACSELSTSRFPGAMRRAALLRRTGIVPNTGVRYGPGSAAHHAVKNGALRCVRGTEAGANTPFT